MGNKEKTIIAAVVLVAVVIVAWVMFRSQPKPADNGNPLGAVAPTTTQNGGVSQSKTVAPAPANVIVPNQGDANVPQNVAMPTVQAAAHPAGGDASYRQFMLSAQGNVFTPSIAIVNKGDVVDFEITAVDKNYDFTQPDYGFNTVAVKKGTTKKVQFEAVNPGKFTFYCASCGGPGAGPVGYLIVTNQ